MEKRSYDISCFYFPNYHLGDRHNELWHGKGWSEWELMKVARPRFEGNDQPKVPLWGYEDEADVRVMEKKIGTAAAYGISNMIFDWYWYEDGPFLNKPLDEAFLKAKNSESISFSVMWANHDWMEIHPLGRAYVHNQKCQLSGHLSEHAVWKAVDYIIANYFTKPNYYRLDGGLFLSIYEPHRLISTFGGLAETKNAIREVRRRVAAAGLGELHLNIIARGVRLLQGEQEMTIDGHALRELGADSVMSYVWCHEHRVPCFIEEYSAYRKLCENDFEVLSRRFEGLPYYPNVTCGWDSGPRASQTDVYEDVGYPFGPTLVNSTPEEFEKALRTVKKALDGSSLRTKMFTINAWNEWTEGSYLEPDTRYGYGKLEAIRKVFGDAVLPQPASEAVRNNVNIRTACRQA